MSADTLPLQTKHLAIGQRITAITAALAPIEATGKNRFRGTALSVEDIEDALRPLFAQYGVLALWTILSDEKWDEKTSEGFMTIWRLNFRIRLMCDDAVDDEPFIEADWFDIGTSPAAAESFAVKGYYRRLFHIASAEDEGAGAQPRRSRESEYNGAPVTDAPITARKSPLEGLPPGFTQEAWDEIKKMASAAKQASTDVQWNGSGLSTPAKVKARVSALYVEPNDDAGGFPLDVATRIAWAVENIKGELEAISTSDPNAADKQRPGAFSFAALGREVPAATGATGESPDTANAATVAVAAPSETVDEEALRKAVIASG